MKYVVQPPLAVPIPRELFPWAVDANRVTGDHERLTVALRDAGISTAAIAGATDVPVTPAPGPQHIVVSGADLARAQAVAAEHGITITASAVAEGTLPEAALDALIAAVPGVVLARYGDIGTIERAVILSVNGFDPIGCAVQVVVNLEMRIRDGA